MCVACHRDNIINLDFITEWFAYIMLNKLKMWIIKMIAQTTFCLLCITSNGKNCHIA